MDNPNDSEEEEDHAEEKAESDDSEIVWEEFYDKIGYNIGKIRLRKKQLMKILQNVLQLLGLDMT